VRAVKDFTPADIRWVGSMKAEMSIVPRRAARGHWFEVQTPVARALETGRLGTCVATGSVMSLEQYCFDKRPLLRPENATVYDAVVALSSNHVGAVMVESAAGLVGILTDRDVAVRVVGRGLDATRTTLHDVMTPEPITLPITASEARAVMLMRAHHVRRIPVLEDQRIVGIVTLDDLLMSGAIDVIAAGALIEAQLRDPAKDKPVGDLYPMKLPPERTDLGRGR
jgi:CBS domain-containing protein